MRSAVGWGVGLGLVVLAIAGALLDRTGLATVAMPRVEGPAPWMLARASGFTAFVALAVDAVLGLMLSTGVLGAVIARGRLIDLHRWTSPVAIALIVAHAVPLLVDGFVGFDALDLVVPFVSAHRPAAVGLGVVATYLVIVVHGTFALRRRIGTRRWRQLHGLSFAGFAAAAAHAVLAGSDAGTAWGLALVVTPALAVTALVGHRLVRRRRVRPR